MEYSVSIGPAGSLPVTSVGQLYGGLRTTQIAVVASGEPAKATPIPIPGPGTPEIKLSPVLLPALQLPSATVLEKLSAPIDLAGTLKAAAMNPALSTVISALPPGALESAGRPGGDATRVRAPSVPESVSDLDWRGGIKLRFGTEPPAYYVDGKKYYVGNLMAFGVHLPDILLTEAEAKGVVRIWSPNEDRGFVAAYLELPAEPGTYAFTFRTSDFGGWLLSKWIEGDDPPIFVACWPYWPPHNGKYGTPAMVMSLGSPGITSILTANPPPDAGDPAPLRNMRRVNLMLSLYYPKNRVTEDVPDPRFLFAGLDIVRIN